MKRQNEELFDKFD